MMIVETVYIHTDHLGDFRRIYYRRTGLAGEDSSRRLKAMRSASGQLTVGQHRQAQEQIAGAAGQDAGGKPVKSPYIGENSPGAPGRKASPLSAACTSVRSDECRMRT